MPEAKPKSAEKPPVKWSSDLYDGTKVLSRQRHLELLVFVVIDYLMDHMSEDDMQAEPGPYSKIRELMKPLVHERRPDGSSYR